MTQNVSPWGVIVVTATALCHSAWGRGAATAAAAAFQAHSGGGGRRQGPLFQSEDVIDTLHQSYDYRLPGHEVTEPVQQLPIHDVWPFPAGAERVNGSTRKTDRGKGKQKMWEPF